MGRRSTKLVRPEFIKELDDEILIWTRQKLVKNLLIDI